jgi:hypothetical protein
VKQANSADESAAMAARRTKFLAERPSKGDVRYHDGQRVRVQGVDDFNFTVKIETDNGVETVPFDDLTETA